MSSVFNRAAGALLARRRAVSRCQFELKCARREQWVVAAGGANGGVASAPAPAIGFAFDKYDSLIIAVNVARPARSVIYVATSTGASLLGEAHLTDQELANLLAWIQSGAHNTRTITDSKQSIVLCSVLYPSQKRRKLLRR